MVEWRAVAGWEAYEVSDEGQVRRGQRVLRTHTPNHGYECFDPQRGKHLLVHRLVAEAFLGPPADTGLVVRHLHGGKEPRASQLAWGTPRENKDDAVRLNEMRHGVAHPRAKLNDDLVRKMRELRARGASYEAIRKVAGCAYNTAEMAVKRRTWRHVQ